MAPTSPALVTGTPASRWPWRFIFVRSLAAIAFTAIIVGVTYTSTPGSGLHLLGTSMLFNLASVAFILDAQSWRACVAQAPAWLLCLFALAFLSSHLHASLQPANPPLGALLGALATWLVSYFLCSTAARRYLERHP